MIPVALDLWPDDIGHTDPTTAPVAVLREQAAFLSRKTQGLVEGEVKTHVQQHDFAHEFFLIAPALDFYRHRLFTVSHGLDKPYYPVTLHLPEKLEIQDSEHFIAALKQFLSSSRVKNLIETLLVQSQST